MSAHEIVNSVLKFKSNEDKTTSLSQELLESNLDAAQTIVLCAQHQTRIIDDVLTLVSILFRYRQSNPTCSYVFYTYSTLNLLAYEP
jgi:hypothetical protein